jgi:ABC-type sulfate/molybdate transport systems ATPase subunit
LLRQDPGLFPHLTVLQNICYPPQAEEGSARTAASRMGLGPLLEARPRGLSGGEAQRVALCRALQPEVRLLCLDEPFSSLDRPLGSELLELVRAELQARGTAALLVTHQLQEAQAFASRMAVLHRGSLLQVGDPGQLVLHPNSALVASLVGYRGWLRRGEQLIAMHPDRVQLSQPAGETGAISGRVVAMRPDGARVDVEVEVEGEWRGRFHWTTPRAPQLGDRLDFRTDQAPHFSGPEAVFG